MPDAPVTALWPVEAVTVAPTTGAPKLSSTVPVTDPQGAYVTVTGVEDAPGSTAVNGAGTGTSKPAIGDPTTVVTAAGGTAIENDPSAAGASDPTAMPPCCTTRVIEASWPGGRGVPEDTTVPTSVP